MLLSRPTMPTFFCLPCPFVINNNRILLFVCLAINDHEMNVNRILSFTYLVLSPEARTFPHHIKWFDMIVCIVCNHHIQQHTHPRGTWSCLSLPSPRLSPLPMPLPLVSYAFYLLLFLPFIQHSLPIVCFCLVPP